MTTLIFAHFMIWLYWDPWSRKWQPILVFLPGKFHGQRSLVGYIQPIGSQRVRYHWVTKHLLTKSIISYTQYTISCLIDLCKMSKTKQTQLYELALHYHATLYLIIQETDEKSITFIATVCFWFWLWTLLIFTLPFSLLGHYFI